MKIYFYCVFMVLSCSLFAEDYINELYESVKPSIVSMEVDIPEEIKKEGVLKRGIYYGTGFVIKKGFILTTRRVVQDQLKAKCICFDNKIILAKVVAYDNESPLTLLKMERFDLPALDIDNNYQIGDVVLSLGNTYGSMTKLGETSVSKGIISGIFDYTRWGITLNNTIETDAAVNPGIYGGPLINLEGKSVGIIFSGYNNSRFQGLVLSVQTIKKFLARYEKGEIYEPDEIFLLQTLPIYLGANVKTKNDQVIISQIEPDSPAQESLMIDDIIMQIGDIKIKSQDEFYKIIHTYFPGQKVSVTINRKNLIMVVPISLVGRFMR